MWLKMESAVACRTQASGAPATGLVPGSKTHAMLTCVMGSFRGPSRTLPGFSFCLLSKWAFPADLRRTS